MRKLLTVLTILLAVSVSLGQEEIYFPQHEGMTGARWSPDGNYIATWGESPLVRIWNDHDGSLALELDHSALTFELPNGKLPDMFSKLLILGADWSEDMRHIITFVQPDYRRENYFQAIWFSDSGEHLYSHFWGIFWHYLGKFVAGHEVVEEDRIVAAWYRDAMSFINVDPASASFGEELATIRFDERVIGVDTRWNDERTEALLVLHPGSDDTCTDCSSTLELIDTSLDTEFFGIPKWRHPVPREIRVFAWPNLQRLLVIQIEDRVEVWDLNTDSAHFGSKILQIELKGEKLHDLIYDETSRRLVIPEVKETFIRHDVRRNLPDCYINECEFQIGVRDLDRKSATFGVQLYEIEVPYYWYLNIDAWPLDLNRLNLNESHSQIHVYSVTRTEADDGRDLVSYIFSSYDLDTGERIEARDFDPEYREDWHLSAFRRPQLDFDFELRYTTGFPISEVIAVNPRKTKVIATLTDANSRQTWWYLVNVETGEYLFPDGQWRVPQGAG